ncbi:hypothetical protein N0V82_000869 [Gnomoniopsis sp. IMI 355080]|nr:hypothetical protein N0V82_000869 [Gnomoniopsis sp. IMI 355080]
MLFSKDTRDMRTVWGYTFEWTPEHQTKEQLHPLIHTYDVLASECLDRLDQLSPPSTAKATPVPHSETQDAKIQGEKEGIKTTATTGNQDPKLPTARRDLYALLATHHATDATLSALWSQLHTIPAWVDWAQIARGQAVFYRYGGPAIVSLTFQSLVGGMAGWRVVETLSRTGGFHVKAAKHRLLETFQHVLQVTKDLASVQPGGEGFAASVRVRLLHASVRRRILALAKEQATRGDKEGQGYFDVDAWGIPINDLDSIGTVLSFSAALIWIGLPRQGIYLTQQEIQDYHALWRWIAYLLGTPTDTCLADWRASKAFFESLIVAELTPSEMGGVLANNILTGLSNQPPAFASREFMCAEARWLNGGELCDALGIARILYKLTVENKEIGLGQETIFDFKYVPQIGLTTTLGDMVEGKRLGGAERRSVVTLVVVTALVGSVAWFGLRSALRLVTAGWG